MNKTSVSFNFNINLFLYGVKLKSVRFDGTCSYRSRVALLFWRPVGCDKLALSTIKVERDEGLRDEGLEVKGNVTIKVAGKRAKAKLA